MRVHFIFAVAFSVISAALFSGNVSAADYREPCKVVRVGYNRNSEPFMNGGSEDEPKGGYAYEYLQTLAVYTGWKYEYVYGDFTELYAKLVSGEIDLLGDISFLEERRAELDYPDFPMGTESYYIYASPAAAERIMLDDDAGVLDGMSICCVGGESFQYRLLLDWLEDKDISLDIVFMSYDDVSFDDFKNGKFDLLVLMDSVADISFEPLFRLGASDIYLTVSKMRPDILAELNSALNEIFVSNPYFNQQLWERYYSNTSFTRRLSARERKWFDEHPRLRIGCLKDGIPFSFHDEGLERTEGIIVYLTECLKNVFGVESDIEFSFYDQVNEAEVALKNGVVDVIFPSVYDLDSAEKSGSMMSKPVMSSGYSYIFGNKKLMNSIAVVKNSQALSYVSRFFPNASVIEADSFKECLDLVMRGTVSGAVVSSFKISRYISLRKKYRSLNVMNLPNSDSVSFCVMHENYVLVSALNKLVNYVRSADRLNEIVMNLSLRVGKYTMRDFFDDYLVLIMTWLAVSLVLLLSLFVALDRLKMMINYDVLTHLMNRRKLTPYFDTALSRAIQKGEPFSILIFDLDDFKHVNDTYGHSAGDDVLKMASSTILKGIDRHDMAFRWGGEEFLVLMRADPKIVRRAAERIRAAISSQKVMYRDKSISITATIGVSSYTPGATRTSMFQEADRNLYEGKRSGKNKVVTS